MTFWGGIFNRPRPWPDLRASDDFQPGDLAVCAGRHGWKDLNTGMVKDGPGFDDILRVTEVAIRNGYPFLRFETWPRDWFAARHFRKITPRQREACDSTFAGRMKRLRPRVDA